MAGFRVLAIILALICLAGAMGLFFPSDPRVIKVREVVLRPPELLVKFKESDPALKNYLSYMINGSSIIALGLGLLFLISVFNPLGMRSFVVVVIVVSLVWIPLAIWRGTVYGIPKIWLISDVLRCLILAVLLYIFFPRKEKPAPAEGGRLKE